MTRENENNHARNLPRATGLRKTKQIGIGMTAGSRTHRVVQLGRPSGAWETPIPFSQALSLRWAADHRPASPGSSRASASLRAIIVGNWANHRRLSGDGWGNG